MRLLRVRFTIWRLMIAIAIIGLPLGLIAEEEEVRQRRLSESYRSLAAYHESRTVASIACSRTRCTFTDHRGRIMRSDEVRASDWHRRLAEKYRHAAARPWLPVEPDPPLP
jgi:hypothetical protein